MDRRIQEKIDNKYRLWYLLDECKLLNNLGFTGMVLSIISLPTLILMNNFKFHYGFLFPGYAFASVGISLPLLSLLFMYLNRNYFKDENEVYWIRYKEKSINIALPSLTVIFLYFVLIVILSPF
jgi:hypothetical protein